MTDNPPDPLHGDFNDELDDLEPNDMQVVEPSEEHYPIVQLNDQGRTTPHEPRK
jgi:hypothetical protein